MTNRLTKTDRIAELEHRLVKAKCRVDKYEELFMSMHENYLLAADRADRARDRQLELMDENHRLQEELNKALAVPHLMQVSTDMGHAFSQGEGGNTDP